MCGFTSNILIFNNSIKKHPKMWLGYSACCYSLTELSWTSLNHGEVMWPVLWFSGQVLMLTRVLTGMSLARLCTWAGERRRWPSSAGACCAVTVRAKLLGNHSRLLPAQQDDREQTACESTGSAVIWTHLCLLYASDVPISFCMYLYYCMCRNTKTSHEVCIINT